MISLAKKLSTKFLFLVNNSQTFDILRQTNCYLCDEKTLSKSKICHACAQDFYWNKRFCRQCSLPLNNQSNYEHDVHLVCGECLTNPPPFTSSVAPFVYSFPISVLIQRIKYRNEQYWIEALSLKFIEHLNQQHPYNLNPEVIIPVPIHHTKLKKRGFNQAEAFAKHLSKHLHIPAEFQVLSKTKESDDQASLKKTQRLKNLRNCFSVQNSQQIKGKHLALVDDVMTTKATSEICSQLLLDSGAQRVDIWCLARTPKDKSHILEF
jgi:ComF family protein